METIFCFDLCGAVALVSLIAALIVRGLVRGRTNRLFLYLCVSILIDCVFNMWSYSFGYFFEITAYNYYLRHFIDYTYFLVRNFTPVLFVLYLCSYVSKWYKLKSSKSFFWMLTIPYTIEVILLVTNIFSKKLFYYDADMNYVRGGWFAVFYVITIYYILLALTITIRSYVVVQKKKRIVLLAYMPINAVAAVITFIFPYLVIDNFAAALTAIMLALEIQRPEEQMDYVMGTRSFNAFLTDLDKDVLSSNRKSYLFVKIVNQATLRSTIGQETFTSILRLVSDKMYQVTRVMKLPSSVYYLEEGDFAITASAGRYDDILDVGRVLAAYMQESIRLDQLEVMLDARVVLVRYPEDITTKESLVNFAHSFHNKLPADNRVMSLSTMADSKDFRMRNDLDEIINRGIVKYNFQMFYQPIYSVEKGKFVSAEALIRLEDEKYGFVSPALFIPAAEESGAIHQIGDFVLEDVCRFIGSNDFKSLGLEYIEINLSVAQCIESDLFEKIDALMEKYGVRPEQINLEITETGVNHDPETTDRNISLLSERGITFSLDDYGTGYSSIRRVVTLPLNIVKLDKSLVDEMDSPMMWTVIKNTVAMLKHMNKKILVEGVEDKRQLDRFVELECDYIQGYYFSRPLNESAFLKFVIAKNFGVEI